MYKIENVGREIREHFNSPFLSSRKIWYSFYNAQAHFKYHTIMSWYVLLFMI